MSKIKWLFKATKIATGQWICETCWVASMCPSRSTLHLVLSLRVPDQCISGLHFGSSHWEPWLESGGRGTVRRRHFFPSLSVVSPQTVCISAEGYSSSQGNSGLQDSPLLNYSGIFSLPHPTRTSSANGLPHWPMPSKYPSLNVPYIYIYIFFFAGKRFGVCGKKDWTIQLRPWVAGGRRKRSLQFQNLGRREVPCL